MLLSKEDLSGKYEWSTGYKSILFSGSPTRRLFDRWNGFQVLFLINCIAALSENFSLKEGEEVERLIHNGLPLTVQSELTVFSWLRQNAFDMK
jgi:hypothetical protein